MMEKKRSAGILFLIASLVFINLALADEPPSWDEFKIQSANGKYIAEVKTKEKTDQAPRWTWSYKLSVFEIVNDSKVSIWSCDYDYKGYSGGILSDDGSTFVFIHFFYVKDAPIVLIYRNGNKIGEFLGRDFNVKQSKLVPTASHHLWLNEDGTRYKFTNTESLPLALEITTIDKKKHIIDAEFGKLLQ